MAHSLNSNNSVHNESSIFKTALAGAAIAGAGYGAYKGVNYIDGINKATDKALNGATNLDGVKSADIKSEVLKQKVKSDIDNIFYNVKNVPKNIESEKFTGGIKKTYNDIKADNKALSIDDFISSAKNDLTKKAKTVNKASDIKNAGSKFKNIIKKLK